MIRRERGFSLVEMLIAMVIAVIMVAVMYSFFTNQHRTYIVQDNVADMQQNARMSLLTVFRNVRMAGYGVPTSCAIAPINNVGGADGIFVSDASAIQTLPDSQIFFAELTANANAGDSSIALTTTDVDDDGTDDFVNRGALIISDGTNTEGLVIASTVGKTVTFSAPFLQNNYPADTTRVVPAIFYNVAGGKLLQDSQALAFDIEDLQISYQDANGAWYCNAPGASPPTDVPPTDIASIRVVEINVLARTKAEDVSEARFTQPSIKDHTVSSSPQTGFRRRLLTTRVNVRNMGRL
jgi:prepilin-type N-terminal cleavage/methylation domain-containing protein